MLNLSMPLSPTTHTFTSLEVKTWYVTREMEIKLIMRYHYRPIEMAKTQNTDNIKCCGGCGATGTLIHCWWECKILQTLWKTVWQFLAKLNILLP